MLSKEEAQRAAANLSKKTHFSWKIKEKDSNVYSLELEIQQKMKLGEFAANFKKMGIDFQMEINEYKEGKYVHVRAEILNQQDILALANNHFNYPILSNNVLVDAAKTLDEITHLNWFVSGNEVTVTYPIEQRPQLAKHDLQVQLANKGFEFVPDFHSQLVVSMKDGKQVRYDKATATIPIHSKLLRLVTCKLNNMKLMSKLSRQIRRVNYMRQLKKQDMNKSLTV